MITSNAKIYELQNPPTDSISEVCFSTSHPIMIASSWDGSLSLYNPSSTTGYINRTSYTKPLLTCCFSKDTPTHAFSGSVDGNVQFIDLEKMTINNIKAHTDGVRCVRAIYNSIVTASWDKTIKVWDTRTAQCVKTINCDGKVFCMDIQNNLVAYGTSTNCLYSMNINKFDESKKHTPRFSYMLKSISCGTDDKSVLVGGIEGKCEMINTTSFYNGVTFRSHRKENKVFAVNSVGVYPKNSNVLVTGGSNGDLIFYDNLSRVKTFTKSEDVPITSGAFSSDGSMYAYALGDDWSTGYDGVYRSVSLKVIDMNSLGIKL